jgi:hypothetical protein
VDSSQKLPDNARVACIIRGSDIAKPDHVLCGSTVAMLRLKLTRTMEAQGRLSIYSYNHMDVLSKLDLQYLSNLSTRGQ